jgi:hypothetical protein
VLSLTGRPFLVLVAVAALAAVLATVAVATGRLPVPRLLARRRGAHGALVLVLVVVAQLLAVSSVAVAVNDSYDFYASWSDALGLTSTAGTVIKVGGLVGSGQGRVVVRTVHRNPAGRDDQVIVWLPPQYHRPAYRHHRFPVVMFLSGQPSTPHIAFRNFNFARIAAQQIKAGKMPPFIGVFPTLMVSPPRDTECTNIPGGPQAESWLSRDVPAYLTHHFRADWGSAPEDSAPPSCSSRIPDSSPRRLPSAVTSPRSRTAPPGASSAATPACAATTPPSGSTVTAVSGTGGFSWSPAGRTTRRGERRSRSCARRPATPR